MTTSFAAVNVQPSLEDVQDIINRSKTWKDAPNLIPICTSITSEFLTPSAIYLKVAAS
jgi:anthranilate synthase component 1